MIDVPVQIELENRIVETASPTVTISGTMSGGDLDVIATSIRAGRDRMRHDVVAIGRDLLRAKGILGHGKFLPWLKAEIGWEPRTAQRFMSVAERLGDKCDSLTYLGDDLLYKLAAPSTPATVIDLVVSQALAGEKLNANAVSDLIREARPPRAKSTPSTAAVEPPTMPGQAKVPIQASNLKPDDQVATTTLNPPEPVSPAPPIRTGQQVKIATGKVFDQLKMLKPERLKILCPALRVCDPAALAGMLETYLKVKESSTGG